MIVCLGGLKGVTLSVIFRYVAALISIVLAIFLSC